MTIEPTNDNGDIYTPIMEEEAFDARESSGRRAMLLLAGAFGFLLLIALILLKAYGPGTRGPDEPPRILADTSPYKSAPENPGGAETPNQDKTVYDVVSGDSRAEDVVLAPDAEEPIKVEPKPNAATVIVKKPQAAKPKAVTPPKTTKPAVKKPTVKKPAVITAPRVAVGNGDYVVQVASLRSQDEANTSWNKLNTKVGDMIPSALYADIKRADLAEKGVFYRLRVAGFADKASASDFCARLKARSQDCIVVRK